MAAGDKIPEEHRKDITDVYNFINNRLPAVPPRHLEYLFEAYNTYISPHAPKDINCRTEVARVLKVFRLYSQIWSKQEQSSQK